MVSTCKKIFFVLLIILPNFSSIADTPYFIDFKYVLNESAAGKKAQSALKSKLDKGLKSLSDKEKALKESEKKIIQQKKLITPEEYKKKVEELRVKVSSLQKERNKLLSDVSKQRAKAKNELLKTLNPIIENYMKEKNIAMIIDKKNILSANNKLDITKDITSLLNQKLKSIKIN